MQGGKFIVIGDDTGQVEQTPVVFREAIDKKARALLNFTRVFDAVPIQRE